MKGFKFYMLFTVLGAALLIFGGLLPLWVKHGVVVTGWEGDYLSVGKWVLALVGHAVICCTFIPSLRKPTWVTVLGFIGLVQSALVLWKGYKLQAIGYGAWLLLAGAVLVLIGAWLMRKQAV